MYCPLEMNNISVILYDEILGYSIKMWDYYAVATQNKPLCI